MEKRLFRTRRRKRWAALAVLFVLGSAALAFTPKVKRDGWWSVMPNTVLILALRNDWDTNAHRTLSGRLYVVPLDENDFGYVDYDKLFGWQLSVLSDAAMNTLEHSDNEDDLEDAHYVLEAMIGLGRDLPDRYVDILVDFIRDPFIRGEASYWIVNRLESEEVQSYLSEKHGRIYQAFLDHFVVATNERIMFKYSFLTTMYTTTEQEIDDLAEIIPKMQNSACAAELWQQYAYLVEDAILPEDGEALNPWANRQSSIEKFVPWLRSEFRVVRVAGQYAIFLFAMKDQSSVVRMLREAVAQTETPEHRDILERTLRLASIPDDPFWAMSYEKGSKSDQLAAIERLWAVDPELTLSTIEGYGSSDFKLAVDLELHAIWLNRIADPECTAAFFAAVEAHGGRARLEFLAGLATRLDDPPREVVEMLKKLQENWNEAVSNAATDALEKMKVKANAVETVDDQ